MDVAKRLAVGALVAVTALPSAAARQTGSWMDGSSTDGYSSPTGLAYDVNGGLYVTEWSAHKVTYVDRSDRRCVVTDRIPSPSGVTLGRDGAVYVASYSEGVVYRLHSDGNPEVFVRGLRTPAGLSIGSDGSLLIADRGLNQVLRADASGKVRVIARDLATPVGVVEFPDGALVVSNISGTIVEIRPDGRKRELARELRAPGVGIVMDGPDAVLVPDYGGTSVWRVTRDGSAATLIVNLRSPVAMARSSDGTQLAVGNWGDSTLRRYNRGGER